MKKTLALILALCMVLALAACGASGETAAETPVEEAPAAAAEAPAAEAEVPAVEEPAEEAAVYKVGICNYVDDASLNQIVANIESELAAIGEAEGVVFDIDEQNCNADASVLEQIIANFIADDVDLMVAIATPVAMAMQAATEDNGIPVVFAAVSDPISTGIVESMDAPGANITGTSDGLDTAAVMKLIFAADPEADNVALLYDLGQDSSTTPIAEAKAFLDGQGVSYTEYNGGTVDEVRIAVDALIADGMDAVFTPTDNTIMTAELSIYETLAEAGVPHYCGADSFALNGAFVGYGVDYANLGAVTGDIVADILLGGLDPASYPVVTFDNGIATVNTETCEAIGFVYEEIEAAFAPLCTQVQAITTAESFDELG